MMFLLHKVFGLIKNYKPILGTRCRTGTKMAATWLVFSGILIVWLIVGLPILGIFYPHLLAYAGHISDIIMALVGGASVIFASNEVRKTFENVKIPTKEEVRPRD